jgi:hypothetical protein
VTAPAPAPQAADPDAKTRAAIADLKARETELLQQIAEATATNQRLKGGTP